MWTKEVASIWKNYAPPCRPSTFEIESCIKQIQSNNKLDITNINVLILGSTTEYREMCRLNNWNATIVDYSIDYHKEITKELQFVNEKEVLLNQTWQSINFKNHFDLIVGDLVIGNLPVKDIEGFLKQLQAALKSNGVIITKSVFYDESKPIIDPSVFFSNYEEKFSHLDPFQFNAYNLTTYAMNKETNILLFKEMFDIVLLCYDDKIITEKTLIRYKEFGWEDALKSEFYVMPISKWESYLSSIFSSFKKQFTPYFWGKNFPFYIINK